MLTRQERFRLGFLTRCAEEQLAMPEVETRMKIAADTAADMKKLANIASGIVTYPLTAAMIAALTGLGGGALAGHLYAKHTADDSLDPEIAKKYELMAAYRQYADAAKRNAKVDYLKAPKP